MFLFLSEPIHSYAQKLTIDLQKFLNDIPWFKKNFRR